MRDSVYLFQLEMIHIKTLKDKKVHTKGLHNALLLENNQIKGGKHGKIFSRPK